MQPADVGESCERVVEDVGYVVEEESDEADKEVNVVVALLLEAVAVDLVWPEVLYDLGDVVADCKLFVVVLFDL